MKYKAPKTTCRCGNPRRPKAQNCHECHRAAQKEYRKKLRELQTGSSVYVDKVRNFKRKLLLNAVKAEGGNMCRASIRLGVARSTMTRAMREAGLSREDVKAFIEGKAA